MDNTQRFSSRVDNYVKYRPHYPRAVLRILEAETGLTPDRIVADIGSGTGISTTLFLDNGNKVYGVEPNQPMREKAEELLAGHAGFISIDGTAENTNLPDSSVDLVIAGQAFHWFEPVATKAEFARITQPDGYITLMFNERLVISDFEKAYEDLLLQFGTDYGRVDHRNITDEAMTTFFEPAAWLLKETPNQQIFNWQQLRGRLLSSSYVPDENTDTYAGMMRDLERIFAGHEKNGTVKFDYITKLYIGKANHSS